MGAQWNQYDGDALLKAHGYDPRYWRVIESTCAKRGDVWSSRVKVVAREVPQLDGEELASHLEEAVNRLDAPVSYRDTDGVKWLLLALYDIHYGRRGVDGDYRRTESEVKSVVTQLVSRLTEESVKQGGDDHRTGLPQLRQYTGSHHERYSSRYVYVMVRYVQRWAGIGDMGDRCTE